MTTETTETTTSRAAYLREWRLRKAVERARAEAANLPAPVTVEPKKRRTDFTAEWKALPPLPDDRGPGAAVRYGDPGWDLSDPTRDPASPHYVFTMPLTPEHLARIKAAGARMRQTGVYGSPLCGPRWAHTVNVNGTMVPVKQDDETRPPDETLRLKQ